MITDWQGGEPNFIFELEDFPYYEILLVEDWKPGVVRLHVRNGNNFYLAYCRTELLQLASLSSSAL